MSGYARPEILVKELLSATRKMVVNQQVDTTLEQVFNRHFYPALGLSQSDMRPVIEHFYASVYPALRPLIEPRPEAIHLVETAVRLGLRLVVATNPLFPKTAILQRLAWGGLPVDKFPFELITSYETMHFAKPNPAYYAEIYARLGWPDEPVLMAGNDPDNDITPAAQAGFATFWLNGDKFQDTSDASRTSLSGNLADLEEWLATDHPVQVMMDLNCPEALQVNLQATPAALFSMVEDFPRDRWNTRPAEREWCLVEVICHLRDVENEVNLPRILKVVAEQNPFLPGMDTDKWAQERSYNLQSGSSAMNDFMAHRIQLLALLDGLSQPDWERPARHAIFGPTQIKELVSIIANHDRLHVQQAYRCIQSISA
jgi:FMN phosphatase YigB (HAD superfamily)